LVEAFCGAVLNVVLKLALAAGRDDFDLTTGR
jgi:hypothetical protein